MHYERLVSGVVLRPNDDGSITSIPPDEANGDYRTYLEWVAAGNEATVRPEPEIVAPVDLDAEQAELDAGIAASTTLLQLKAALLGSKGGRVKARPGA